MKKEFKLPELGENIHGGTVTGLLVKESDALKIDQPVLELETDKAVIEVPSSVEGIITQIIIKEGDEIKVGQLILTVESDAPSTAASPGEPVKSKVESTEPKIKDASEAPPAESPEAIAKTPDGPSPETLEVAEKPLDDAAEAIPLDEDAPKADDTSDAPAKLIPASPSVRRFAREIGIDLHQVQGSGQRGRISLADVKVHARAIRQERPN